MSVLKQVTLFRLLTAALLIFSTTHSFAQEQKELIKAGPMVGYSYTNEVALWIQTTEEADVQFAYWPLGEPKNNFASERVKTLAKDSFVTTVVLSNLNPGTIYEYIVLINGFQIVHEDKVQNFQTQHIWEYRYDPPAFRIALGSCTYINEEGYDRPGKPYGAGYEIFETMSNRSPNLMLWLGDNTYLRAKEWNNRSGILHRHSHTRAIPELQNFLGKTHHYAIWDDHDFGPNDATFSFYHRDKTKEAFNLFWPNPGSGNSYLGGITYSFQWNDIDFFMLDDRWFRTAKYEKGYSQMLGKGQIDWLIDGLKRSRSPYKIVACGSQVLNTAKVYENYANYDEREYLLRRIEEENIKGVVFVTGDRHHSELSKLKLKNGNTIYDFTVSPLTSGPSTVADDEKNENRVEGSYKAERNFGEIFVKGKRKNRVLKLSLFNANGEEIWKTELKGEDFGYPPVKDEPEMKEKAPELKEEAPAEDKAPVKDKAPAEEKAPVPGEEEAEPENSPKPEEKEKKD